MTPGFQPAWLRGPITGISPLLQPVAHALIDADEDVARVVSGMSPVELAAMPGGAASVAFHVIHAIGSLDRLFTYARGRALDETQLAALAGEKTLDAAALTGDALAARFSDAVRAAHTQLASTPDEELLQVRLVGRAQLPSTTLGLLVHGAEHTARHVGQVVTTARVVVAGR